MKKPLRPAAILLWWLSALCFLVPLSYVGMNGVYFLNWVAVIVGAIFNAGVLFGLGVLVEIADQVRWNSLPQEKRVVRRTMRTAIRYLREWPHNT